MSHYETLGVARDASPEDIKRAWRSAMSRAHPDKGGSEEMSQRINKAYEILSDPERREMYDLEGDEGLRKYDENSQALIQMVTGIFNEVIDADAMDPIAATLQRLEVGHQRLNSHLEQARRELAKMRRKKGYARDSEGGHKNLFDEVLQQRIDTTLGNIDQLIRAIEVNERATALVSSYSWTGPQGLPMSRSFVWNTLPPSFNPEGRG